MFRKLHSLVLDINTKIVRASHILYLFAFFHTVRSSFISSSFVLLAASLHCFTFSSYQSIAPCNLARLRTRSGTYPIALTGFFVYGFTRSRSAARRKPNTKKCQAVLAQGCFNQDTQEIKEFFFQLKKNIADIVCSIESIGILPHENDIFVFE